jgi:hypothetical protein
MPALHGRASTFRDLIERMNSLQVAAMFSLAVARTYSDTIQHCVLDTDGPLRARGPRRRRIAGRSRAPHCRWRDHRKGIKRPPTVAALLMPYVRDHGFRPVAHGFQNAGCKLHRVLPLRDQRLQLKHAHLGARTKIAAARMVQFVDAEFVDAAQLGHCIPPCASRLGSVPRPW